MSKIAVVYWSGTGNTEAMAAAVCDGILAKGSSAQMFTPSEFDPNMVADFDAIAFGCPSMGAEELEPSEFEPLFDACKPALKEKKIALFGSYGWGVGQWMEDWEEVCDGIGAVRVADSVICNDAPEADTIMALKALGAALI